MFGDPEAVANLPPAYQEQEPFGADIGGTHQVFWAMHANTQFDSYLTIGHLDLEHPDILDDVSMLLS
eukprot:SAG11_NODE_27904_length_327_cov_1.114035_1_plen_66_part_10